MHLGSCALAIEMVETFPPKVLMPYPARYPASDVGTWGAISAAALGVYKYCLMEHAEEGMPKVTGWSQVGMYMFSFILSEVFLGIYVGLVFVIAI